MKKLLLLISFVLNLVLLQAQKVEFISVNDADTSLQNINFKSLQKHLQKDSLTADTTAAPAKWMVKLNKKLTKQQRQDSNIYIFFVPNPGNGISGFLPLSGKYGYVLFDTAKIGATELEKVQKRLSTHKYQWDLIHDPESMIALFQDEEEGASVEEGPISEVTRFINTIKCAKNKNLETVTIHHSVNSYSVKVRDVLGQLNKYRGSSPSIVSDEFKKAYLNVYIDDGMFSSATDFYFGYHNFRLSVNDYERKPVQGTDSEKLIFTANGEPIIFSFPLGTDAGIQKDVLDWLERECGIESGGSPFKSINFNIGSDDIEDLFSLSTCQLEQIDKGDRKTLIGEALENVEGFLGVSKDSYQYLLASLIASTPKADVEDLVNYLSGIGDKLELAYLDLSSTAQEVFIGSLCEIAEKSWDNTEYLGKINSYLLGVQALSKDLADKVNVGMCGVFDVSPGVYRFSRAVWLSEDGKYPYNKIKPEGAFEVSAFDPIESHIIGVDNYVGASVIYPAIVTKILATQLHIANIDHLLEIPKSVLLPEVTANIFAAVPRVGTATTNLLKGGISTTTGGLSKLLGQCGELGYKLKKAGTEIALYTNLNVEIARFSGKGKLLTEVYPSSRIGANVIVLEDEISYTSAVSKESKNGYIELARDADGNLFFKEVAGKWFEELPEGLRTDIGSLDSDLGKLFANATEAERGGLVEGWKILSNGSTSLKSIDNINAVHAFRAANPGIADDAIQAAFDGLKTSRKQAFVNALGSCADNKNLIGSLNKTKLASVDEIKDALNKMRDYRSGVPAGGNYGYLEGNIPGVTVDNNMWRSGSVLEGEPQIFDAIEVQGANGGSWLRNTDSEYKMLNDLADKLGGVKGQVKSDVTGTLKIVSENPYCTSCQGVIQQFSEMFPNIEIKLIDGVR